MFLVKYEINYQRVTVIKTIVLLYIRYKVMYVNNCQNGYVFVICCNYHRAFTFYSKVYLTLSRPDIFFVSDLALSLEYDRA